MAIIALPNKSTTGRVWVNPNFVSLVAQSGDDVLITLSDGSQIPVQGQADEIVSKLNHAID